MRGFLEYLRKWKESIEQRPGNYTQNARSKMFLSWQTYEGFQITVNSVIEICKFLLQEGMEYVLTNVSVRIQWRNILVVKENWGEEMTTLTFAHSDTTTTPFVYKGQYHVKVETHEEDVINTGNGSK